MTSPHGLAIDAKTRRVFAAGQGKVVMLDQKTGKVLASVDIAPGYVDQIAFDPDKKRLYCACGDAGAISVVGETTGRADPAGHGPDAQKVAHAGRGPGHPRRLDLLHRRHRQLLTAVHHTPSAYTSTTMSQLTRRQFLHSAGGVTFLALVPSGAACSPRPTARAASLPRFTALPYVQPGPSSRLVEGRRRSSSPGRRKARPPTSRWTTGRRNSTARRLPPARTERTPGGRGTSRFGYAAPLAGLALSRRYFYRLRGGGQTIAEGYFTTRKKRGERIRFVAFGDNAYGDPGEKAVAYHAYQAHPDFIMNTGDNVYEHGRDSEYEQFFFPVYNADKADPAVGAPLLRSVPFYSVLANHDVPHKGAGHIPAADFDEARDSLAYYTALHLPPNGPAAPSPTPLLGAAPLLAEFQPGGGHALPGHGELLVRLRRRPLPVPGLKRLR